MPLSLFNILPILLLLSPTSSFVLSPKSPFGALAVDRFKIYSETPSTDEKTDETTNDTAEVPKKRGRPKKLPPPPPTTPLSELDSWFNEHCFDSTKEMNTWEVKMASPLSEPTLKGVLKVVTAGTDADLTSVSKMSTSLSSKFSDSVTLSHQTLGSPTDNLFEVWLESYEHTLLFSRRSAVYEKEWEGGKEIEEEWEGILERIEEEISEDKKFSYMV
ncbi:hypothetical protein TrVE_jg2850 [Triparma verrucosa]|uniref:Uncharacterized protein n=1 Tax=Triparma verrucosa TaxID=1606542 RepID=A0A9W7ET24_9STRA|nr:hypothetical protein TrVE_jg2850 [Triparma verrucosa]